MKPSAKIYIYAVETQKPNSLFFLEVIKTSISAFMNNGPSPRYVYYILSFS